jgi:protein-disulfide isomerase
VSGAARNERRRRQEDAARKAAARQGARKGVPAGPPAADPPLKNKRVLVAAITAAVLVAAFAAVYVFLDRNSATPTPPAAYPVAVDGVVVTAGSPTAPVTLDLYEDYLCPYCERLENRSGGDIGTALNEVKVKVNYHALNILDNRTTPPGYSTLAANAALCAVPAGIWPAFHERLFVEQPAEGGAGLTAAQLTQIGTELGAGQDFGACVEANAQAPAISAATQAAAAEPGLQTDGQFGTPTVAVGGRKIDVSASDWLEQVIAGG